MSNPQGQNRKSSIVDWKATQTAEGSRIARQVLPIAVAVMAALGAFFIGVYYWLGRPWQWTWMVLEMIQAVVLLTLAYALVRRGKLAASIYVTTLTLNLTVIIGPALVEGMLVAGVLASLIAFIFARLLAGPSEKRIVAVITAASLVAGIVLSGFQPYPILEIPVWVQVNTTAAGAVIVVLLIARILDLYDRRYQNSLGQAEEYANALARHREALEDRSAELSRRTRYLEATAAVARDAASDLDVQSLLSRVTTLVTERFGFYHTSIFLLDPTREWAVMAATSSEGGRRMLARGHRLRVGQEGIVGFVARHGTPRVALDVGGDAVFFDNPDLPETRSEMALPLQARGAIIGTLDVQSVEPEAFAKEDVAVLQTLADQVAVAISNARLFQQTQEALEAERRLHRQLTKESWASIAHTHAGLGYRYNAGSVARLGDQPSQADVAWKPENDDLTELTLPIKVRGQLIAQINAHKPKDRGRWTPHEISLMEDLAEELGLGLENARLYQQSQDRAHRERLTRQITEKVRAASDIESIAQTAAEELAKALGGDLAYVKLGIDTLHVNAISVGAAADEEAASVPQQVLDAGLTTSISGENGGRAILVAPIKVRGTVIGALGLQEAAVDRNWSDDDVALVETVADQVAQAVEAARLYDEARTRAQREQLATEIAGKIRSAPDIDGILRTAVCEIRRALGVSHGIIRLGTEMHLRPPNGQGDDRPTKARGDGSDE